MSIIHLKDFSDPRLLAFSDIPDALLRDGGFMPARSAHLVPEHGLFIGESMKVIDRALGAGIRPYALFLEERWLCQSAQLIECIQSIDPEIPVFVAHDGQFCEVTGYKVTRGPLAAFRRPPLPSVRELLKDARRVAILEDITNYTNIGAIFRSAAALGMDAVLVTPSCHDPFYRRASRVSMGTVFQVPWTRIGTNRDWAEEGVDLLHRLGFLTVALALDDSAIDIRDKRIASASRLALVLGSEGDGLSKTTLAVCDYSAIIPMHHDVDSLNVAAASAVAFWQVTQ